eukprot:m.254443 g.254443  ORF g.254443 m.254443 type:complete len:412 (+) comp18956_c0_seq1:74-1309(+)
MVQITLSLIRKRAEHNNGEISSLEEVSLHQQEIEKIELLDQACRNLKILYLQNNVISKIENVARLKEMQYLNLALNNITVIENLEGCESLRKLDLTVNFVGDLRCVLSLRKNRELAELFLTGNPCTQYEGYRSYVVHSLPGLARLDGREITRTERLQAAQEFDRIRPIVEAASQAYTDERAAKLASMPSITELPDDADLDEEEKKFWAEQSDFTPEGRLEAQRRHAAIKQRKEQKENPAPVKPKRNLMRDGRPLNVNEGDWDFALEGQESTEPDLILDIACYRYLDTSQIDLDVHPTHVRVVMKEKIFQLVLPEEVQADSPRCKAERSQTTGHLRITMPKSNPVVQRKPAAPKKKADAPELLEVPDKPPERIDLASIVGPDRTRPAGMPARPAPRANDADFVDDDDVPPLE